MAHSPGDAPGWAKISPSDVALRSKNPIRRILDSLVKPVMPEKCHIPLSLGDPTVFGNFMAPDVLVDTMAENLRSAKHNGYVHSAGTDEARAAIATYLSTPTSKITGNDVVIASGCSGALDMAIAVLLNPGDNMLVPKPAFALYQTLAESKGVGVKHYQLLPERQWEADVAHMESLIDERTKCILVNNPSNPCGSVYSKQHLLEIIDVAERHKLPIISDEIYGNLVFPSTGAAFFPIASLTRTVPVLCVGGIAKEFLVPGWRVGWVAVHDNESGSFADVTRGLVALTTLILGANSLVISCLPSILTPAPGSPAAASLAAFRQSTVARLEEHATYTHARLAAIPGLDAVVPQGAMYVMFGLRPGAFPSLPGDVEFARALLAEENVLLLPATVFNSPGYLRVVFCAPKDVLAEAFDRMEAFCRRHRAPGYAASASAILAAAPVDGSAGGS